MLWPDKLLTKLCPTWLQIDCEEIIPIKEYLKVDIVTGKSIPANSHQWAVYRCLGGGGDFVTCKKGDEPGTTRFDS